MPIMKVGRSESGVVQVDTVDTGERRLSASERARLQLLESKQEEARAVAKTKGDDGAADDSQALVHPQGVGEVDETDRTNEDSPRGETVSTERIRQATGGKTSLPATADQETGRLRDAQRHQRKDSRPNPDEHSIARELEAGLGPDPDVPEDTTVLDDQPKPQLVEDDPAPEADGGPETAQEATGAPEPDADTPEEAEAAQEATEAPATTATPTGAGEYDCPECGMPIKTASGQASHMGAKHPEAWEKLQKERE